VSKLSPLGQSMAALFTPESEKVRKSTAAQANSTTPLASSLAIKAHRLGDAGKAGDSLGNPGSPGYEGPLKRKAGAQEEATLAEGDISVPTAESTSSLGLPKVIRLSSGWEKILMAQKKICEKARGLFLKLEGPDTYITQRKAKGKGLKYQGAILDVDMEAHRAELEAAEKKAKQEAAAAFDKSA